MFIIINYYKEITLKQLIGQMVDKSIASLKSYA